MILRYMQQRGGPGSGICSLPTSLRFPTFVVNMFFAMAWSCTPLSEYPFKDKDALRNLGIVKSKTHGRAKRFGVFSVKCVFLSFRRCLIIKHIF